MTLRPLFSAMRRSPFGPLLVGLQVALTLAILSNALHVSAERQREAATPSGFDEARVVHLGVVDPVADDSGASIAEDVARLRAIPGVLAASYASQVPLSNSGSNTGFQADPDAEDAVSAALYRVDPAYVGTLGLALVSGRDFAEDDARLLRWSDPGSYYPRVALITRSLEEALFPGGSALGRMIHPGRGAPGIEVVGVVDGLVSPWGAVSWGADPRHSVILPQRMAVATATYMLRVDPSDAERVLGEAGEVLQARVPGRILLSARTMAETRAQRYRTELAVIRGLHAVVVLLLVMTAIGVVGLASLWVTQRRKQIGVRRALGARRRDILEAFVLENLMITGMGVLAGAALAYALNAAMMGQLSIGRLPPALVAGGAGALLALGLLAVLAPAWRAARIAPAVATRSV